MPTPRPHKFELMKEEYLHYAFKHKLVGNTFLTTSNQLLQVIDFGEHNANAGPDFLDAKINFDGQIWVGAIEFHVNSSDWFRHNHQNDPAYGNVIAHFVYTFDMELINNGSVVPTVELKSKIDPAHYKKYQQLIHTHTEILCQNSIKEVSHEKLEEQKLHSLNQRLWFKSIRILQDLETYHGDRSDAYYLALARAFGGKVNQLPFEQLMSKINTKWFAKLNYDPFRIEALFFGMAGLLPSNVLEDDYLNSLVQEFDYLKKLFGITQPPILGWKYSRMRPANFPDIRIAQLVQFIIKFPNSDLFFKTDWSLKSFYKGELSGLHEFWNQHYRLSTKKSKNISPKISKEMYDLILINAIIPFHYAIGLFEGNEEIKTACLKFLKTLKPEKNTKMSQWQSTGVSLSSAYDTQAFLALLKQACIQKKCLTCAIGKEILKKWD